MIRDSESLIPSHEKSVYLPAADGRFFHAEEEDSNAKAQAALAARSPKDDCNKSSSDLRSQGESPTTKLLAKYLVIDVQSKLILDLEVNFCIHLKPLGTWC